MAILCLPTSHPAQAQADSVPTELPTGPMRAGLIDGWPALGVAPLREEGKGHLSRPASRPPLDLGYIGLAMKTGLPNAESGQEMGALHRAAVDDKAAAIKPPEAPYALPDDKYRLMRDAGIAEVDFGHVDYIITRESAWDWQAWSQVDPNSYGLPQRNFEAWPLRETEKFMDSPVAQLRWASWYAKRSYGSWWQARAAWEEQGWW